jgi:hypothetical protein
VAQAAVRAASWAAAATPLVMRATLGTRRPQCGAWRLALAARVPQSSPQKMAKVAGRKWQVASRVFVPRKFWVRKDCGSDSKREF